ncbi:MAG: type 1 glutamine amidotransferase [Planctomycetota bacterium]|jgi:GMP synthase (glutamine-hydrolysing)
MRFHWLQNVGFEDAAEVGVWATAHGYAVTRTRLYDGEALPEMAGIDALAIMGGPMNVYQYRDYPWLAREKRFIEQAIGAGIPTIGICLGAQLIADVLGAKVVQNAEVEIGWFAVSLTAEAEGMAAFRTIPARFKAFHWHGDTFGIPAGAQHLAVSEACAHQAFAYGDHVMGLQFHLEYSAESIRKMLIHGGDELVDGPYVQSAEQIRAGLSNVEGTRRVLDCLLGSLFGER